MTQTTPLGGIRVLDLSRILSGPFCTMNLGDLGAEVLKVEDPSGGDDTRSFGPPSVRGWATYFLSINRNKKSLAVNLKHPEGLALVKALSAKSDVVVENFRPGVAQRLGLGHEVLCAANPRLVYCSISGFGNRGLSEFTQLPGYDLVVQGLSGLQHVTGDPAGPPTKVGVSISDLLSGMTAFQAILTALYTRERTGRGQYLDVAMLDSTVQVLTFLSTAHWLAGRNPMRMGNLHPSIAPYETFQAQDGYLNVAVGTDGQFQRLCELLGEAPLAADARFAHNPDRVAHREALVGRLKEHFAKRPVAEWVSLLSGAGIPAGAINDLPRALAHPQLAARGMVAKVDHPDIGPLTLLGSPLPMEGARKEHAPPPALGEHTRAVLGEVLRLPKEELDRLSAQKVIACR